MSEWTLCEPSRVNKRLWKIKGLRRFIISGRTNITFWILFPLTRFQNWIYRISLLLNGSSLKDRKEKRNNPWRNLANSNPYGFVQSRHQVEPRTCTYATGGKLKDEERRWWRGEIVEKSDDRPVIFHRSFSDAPKRDGSWFNSLETWDESIFPGAIIVGVEAIYGEHVKIQNYKNILVAPYQPIAAALVSNVPTFTYKQRRELACN